MAAARTPISHEPSCPTSKADPPKHHYVPIRPAFRPLLPKASPRELSPSTGIHIHTRTMLNAGRKRVSTSRPDLQKRRKAYPQITMLSSKPRPEVPSESITGASARRLPVATAAVANVASNSLFEKSFLPNQSTYELGISREVISSQGIPPMDVSYQNMDFGSLADSSSASPWGGMFAEKISVSVSSISSLEDAAPSTPSSMSESPTAISTAPLFYPFSDQKSQGTIDPTDITVEGDSFLDQNETFYSLGAFGQVSNSILTPPDSQKPLSAMPFSNFGQGAGYDEFSHLYYRSDSLESISNQLSMTNKATSLSDEASAVMPGGSLDEQELAEKDEDYSFLEYFAPSADLF